VVAAGRPEVGAVLKQIDITGPGTPRALAPRGRCSRALESTPPPRTGSSAPFAHVLGEVAQLSS
jgi:hypothetical protein